MNDFAIWNLIAQSDAGRLSKNLSAQGFVLRELDGHGVLDASGLWARAAETFGFDEVTNWDSFADRMWTALLPDDDEGEKVAFVWHHVDELLHGGLGVIFQVLDATLTIGRQAYGHELQVLTFMLGEGPNFPPLGAPLD